MDKVKVGNKIINIVNEPQYTDREGVVTHIDDAGQIHGTWGGCTIVPEINMYIVILITDKRHIKTTSPTLKTAMWFPHL